MRQTQQGDVLIYSVNKVPDGAKKVEPIDGKFVIAKGEVTGHAHVIEVKLGMKLYEKDRILYLISTVEEPMTHEEHKPSLIDPGITAFETVREKDHFTDIIRQVRD